MEICNRVMSDDAFESYAASVDQYLKAVHKAHKATTQAMHSLQQVASSLAAASESISALTRAPHCPAALRDEAHSAEKGIYAFRHGSAPSTLEERVSAATALPVQRLEQCGATVRKMAKARREARAQLQKHTKAKDRVDKMHKWTAILVKLDTEFHNGVMQFHELSVHTVSTMLMETVHANATYTGLLAGALQPSPSSRLSASRYPPAVPAEMPLSITTDQPPSTWSQRHVDCHDSLQAPSHVRSQRSSGGLSACATDRASSLAGLPHAHTASQSFTPALPAWDGHSVAPWWAAAGHSVRSEGIGWQ